MYCGYVTYVVYGMLATQRVHIAQDSLGPRDNTELYLYCQVSCMLPTRLCVGGNGIEDACCDFSSHPCLPLDWVTSPSLASEPDETPSRPAQFQYRP